MEILKKDWKLFQQKIGGWQENYMEHLIKEYIKLLSKENVNASDKFWELEKRIKRDRRHPGVLIEMRKSNAIFDLVDLIRLKVITFDDLSDFSDELQETVKMILSR